MKQFFIITHSLVLFLLYQVTTLKNYIAAGFSPAKLNLGFATYGRTQSVQGQYTREGGISGFFLFLFINDLNLKFKITLIKQKKKPTTKYAIKFKMLFMIQVWEFLMEP
jgi:GH18 family chitinase